MCACVLVSSCVNLLVFGVLQTVLLLHAELALIAALVDAGAFGGRPEIICTNC